LRLGPLVVLAVAAVAVVPGVSLLAIQTIDAFAFTLNRGTLEQGDVKPHQPRGFPHNPKTSYKETGLEPLANLPASSCSPPARICRAENGRLGALTIEIDSDQPTTVVLRRFFFPTWRITDGPAIAPTEPFRLTSFVAPAGRHIYRLEQESAPSERWSWAVAGLSLVLLLTWMALAWRPPVSRP
jgi:hypothetical protein